MVDRREAQYPWGLTVVAVEDLFNDGSHPHAAEQALLVQAGSEGRIVGIGHHVQANEPVYRVDFDGVVLGVTEDEILPRALLAAHRDALVAGSNRAGSAASGPPGA